MHEKQYKIEPVTVGTMNFELSFFADFDKVVDQFFEEVEAKEAEEKYWPVFGNLWAASIGLAQFLCGLGRKALAGKRVLELGCGLALPSMVASRLGGVVMASDFHPEVSKLLSLNLKLNHIEGLEFAPIDWSIAGDYGVFDCIMASDIFYEPEPPHELIAFLARHLAPQGDIYMADIGRVYFPRYVAMMTEQGFSLTSYEETVTENHKAQKVHIAHFKKL